MNAAAEEIQKQIDALIKKRDSLRGEQIVICGYCYHLTTDNETFDEHSKKSKWCHPNAWPCKFKGYVDEYEIDSDGMCRLKEK